MAVYSTCFNIFPIISSFSLFFQVRAFHVDGVQPVDLLSKPIQIGEYATMTDEHCIYDVNYSSLERAIMLFNEDTDRLHKLDLLTALNNCQLFETNGDLRSIPEPTEGSDEMAHRDRLIDLFINKHAVKTGKTSYYENVQYFGQIDPFYQPTELLERMGTLAAARFKQRSGDNATSTNVRDAFLMAMFGKDNLMLVDDKTFTDLFKSVEVDRVATTTKDSTADVSAVKELVTTFTDQVAASLRDDREVRARARTFLPESRLPTASEINNLRAFAIENANTARWESAKAYADWFDPRKAQFEKTLKNVNVPIQAKATTETIKWIHVGEDLPAGYDYLEDENGERIQSGLYGVTSFEQLPHIRAQRALARRSQVVSENLNVARERQPVYETQGFHGIGMMSAFDEDGIAENEMRNRGRQNVANAGRKRIIEGKEVDVGKESIVENYIAELGNSAIDDDAKVCALLFLGTRVHRDRFRGFITHNLPFPGNFLICRAHAAYRGRTALKVLSGQIGNTYMAHINAEIGQDASRMIGLLHVVSYMSAICTTPQHVFAEQAPFVDQYYGGMGMEFWDPESYQRRSSRGNVQSILCFFVPYAERTFPNPLDISGRFNTEFDYGLFNLSNRYETPHYSTYYRYNNMYEIYTRANAQEDLLVPTVIPDEVAQNRICWQGAQWNYNRMTNKFDIETKNTGHWGPTYAGCGRVRRGIDEHLSGTANIGVTVN